MKSDSILFKVFFFGLFLSSLVFSNSVLDINLSPRLILSGIILLISTVGLIKTGSLEYLKLNAIPLFYLAYVFYSILSSLWANTLSEALIENARLIISFGFFLVCFYFLKSRKQETISLVCKMSIILVIIEFIVLVLQLTQLNAYNKEALYNITGLHSHKNLVSSFLYLMLCFNLMGLLHLHALWKKLAFISIVLTVFAIALLQTKAVWLALLSCGTILFVLQLLKRKTINLNFNWQIFLLMLLVNLHFIFIQPAINTKTLQHNASLKAQKVLVGELDNERMQLWDKTYAMIKEHPLTGVGAGNWQIHFPHATLSGIYRAEDLNYTFQRPHNDTLWIIAELGFIGFNLCLIFILGLLTYLHRTIHFYKNDSLNSREAALILSFIIGFFVCSFFDFPKERIEHLLWMNVLLAMAYSKITEAYKLKEIVKIKHGKLTFIPIIFVLLFVVIISLNRFNGEKYTRKMYDCKKTNNNQGVIKEGQMAINFAYTIDPTSMPVKWFIGNAHALLGEFNEAKTDFTEAYHLNPNNRNVLNDLASAFVQTNQTDSAKKYYLESIRISPRYDEAKLNLAAVYFNEQNFILADSCLKTLLHDSEKRTLYQNLVDKHLR